MLLIWSKSLSYCKYLGWTCTVRGKQVVHESRSLFAFICGLSAGPSLSIQFIFYHLPSTCSRYPDRNDKHTLLIQGAVYLPIICDPLIPDTGHRGGKSLMINFPLPPIASSWKKSYKSNVLFAYDILVLQSIQKRLTHKS